VKQFARARGSLKTEEVRSAADSAEQDQLRARLQEFLRQQEDPGLVVEELEPLRSVGNARQAWRIVARWDDGSRMQSREAVALVQPEAGQLETRLSREFEVLRALEATPVPAPRPLWLDVAGTVFGRPFLATELVGGTPDYGILRSGADRSVGRRVLADLAVAVGQMHVVDGAVLAGWQPSGMTLEQAAVAQVDEWDAIFRGHRLGPMPQLVYAFDWLRDNPPPVDRLSLVHGDLRIGNFLYADGRVTALLDWELAHIGDRHEDIAWLYRAMWSPQEVMPPSAWIKAYEQASGLPVVPESLHWHRMFSEVKHTVISITGAEAVLNRRSTNLRMADRASWMVPFMQEFMSLEDSHDWSRQ
jgi:prepilin-type processing-associated H-X9-DG protein